MFMSFLNHDLVFSKTLLVCSAETKYDNYHFLPLLGPGPDSSVGAGDEEGAARCPSLQRVTPDTRRAFKENSALTLSTCQESGGFRRWRPHSAMSDTSSKPTPASCASDHVAVDWGFPQPPPQTSDASRWSRLLNGRLAVCQRFSPSPPWVHLSC